MLGAPGSPNVLATARIGSYGAIIGAKTATAVRIKIIKAPVTSIVLGRIFTESNCAPSPATDESGTACELNTRIEPGVKQIDQQISNYNQECGEQHRSHYQRDVKVEDGVESEASDSRPVEYCFC